MDPHTNTREEFTHGLVSKPIPDNAAPEWRTHVERHKVLLEKLAQHPAMAPNLGQTYMTPAKSKNNIYFQWDFIGRSLGFMYSVNPTLQNLSKAVRERWQDAVGRATYAKMLITDATPGMLSMMTESTYPDQKGQHPDFGEEILELARHLDD